jgi:hypothetical protein
MRKGGKSFEVDGGGGDEKNGGVAGWVGALKKELR